MIAARVTLFISAADSAKGFKNAAKLFPAASGGTKNLAHSA